MAPPLSHDPYSVLDDEYFAGCGAVYPSSTEDVVTIVKWCVELLLRVSAQVVLLLFSAPLLDRETDSLDHTGPTSTSSPCGPSASAVTLGTAALHLESPALSSFISGAT